MSVYICSGCKIGDCIDTSALIDEFTAESDITSLQIHNALCSVEGLKMITEDIEQNKSSDILIAACSPRYKINEFSFQEDKLVERVNLREQVAWVSDTEKEDIQNAASDYIRMGLAKLRTSSLPEPYIPEDISDEILVIGAGITGITAAIEGAKAGYRIHLVEKEDIPGGYALKLHSRTPNYPPYNKFPIAEVHEKIKELAGIDNINLYLSTTIEQIKGEPGNFEISLKNQKTSVIKAGSIVAAMGMQPYDPLKLHHLGYGKYPNIITNAELEEIIRNGKTDLLPERILFIQCAGSRDKDHLPYCSGICCNTTLRQAKLIRTEKPGTSIFILYKDIRTPGMYEEFYHEIQKDEAIFMTKGEISNISPSDRHLRVEFKNSLSNDDLALNVDMIVLASGIIPNDSSALNLKYRQGGELPELKYNFPDSHFICFPYETRRTGIYAAGTLRAPMDIVASMSDASGAMLKAIQCIEAVKQGKAVHPRSGDMSYPDLFLDRCTDCKRCTEECPFGAYDENEKGTPILNPARCRRCGICLGSCPERVINFADYSINSISSMIKAIHIPDEFEEKLRILAFVCENDAYPAFDMAAAKGLKYSTYLRIIPVRCIGSINNVWISDALSCGFDGILQIGCKPGENYQCHYIHGSELTEKRGKNIQETLQTMMLEAERIKTVFLEITEYYKIPEIINEYVEEIEMIGPNPFKGL